MHSLSESIVSLVGFAAGALLLEQPAPNMPDTASAAIAVATTRFFDIVISSSLFWVVLSIEILKILSGQALTCPFYVFFSGCLEAVPSFGIAFVHVQA